MALLTEIRSKTGVDMLEVKVEVEPEVDKKVPELEAQLAARDKKIFELEAQLAARDAEIAQLKGKPKVKASSTNPSEWPDLP